MATKFEPYKPSKEVKSNIKRLTGIIERQRQYLKSLALDDPEFKQTEAAIKKTAAEIKKAKTTLKESIQIETKVKAEEDLATAEEELKYAKASGDAKEIQNATNAFAIARNSAIKAGVTQKSGALLGAGETGGKIGSTGPTIPAKPTEPVKATKSTVPTNVVEPTKSTESTSTTKTDEQQREEALSIAGGTDFVLPEVIFNNVPSLKRILERYVAEDWTIDKLRKEIRDDVWFKKNSTEIRARYVQLYNYEDLVKSGQAQGTTNYEMQIAKIEANLKKRAAEIGSAAASDPVALEKAAKNLYITNRSEDTVYIDSFLAAAIKPIASMIGGKITEGYSGDALTNYNTLVKTARDNGFQISDILPGGANEQQILAGIANGSIDINRVKQDARKLAAQGQPQYVRDLLSQGYNLKDVFAPYRQVMGTVLDLNPEEIDLNDPLLRTAITDKGDMNLYDFRKALRQDSRWQYTEQAKADVSSAAFNVLRDFGFQG